MQSAGEGKTQGKICLPLPQESGGQPLLFETKMMLWTTIFLTGKGGSLRGRGVIEQMKVLAYLWNDPRSTKRVEMTTLEAGQYPLSTSIKIWVAVAQMVSILVSTLVSSGEVH